MLQRTSDIDIQQSSAGQEVSGFSNRHMDHIEYSKNMWHMGQQILFKFCRWALLTIPRIVTWSIVQEDLWVASGLRSPEQYFNIWSAIQNMKNEYVTCNVHCHEDCILL